MGENSGLTRSYEILLKFSYENVVFLSIWGRANYRECAWFFHMKNVVEQQQNLIWNPYQVCLFLMKCVYIFLKSVSCEKFMYMFKFFHMKLILYGKSLFSLHHLYGFIGSMASLTFCKMLCISFSIWNLFLYEI